MQITPIDGIFEDGSIISWVIEESDHRVVI